MSGDPSRTHIISDVSQKSAPVQFLPLPCDPSHDPLLLSLRVPPDLISVETLHLSGQLCVAIHPEPKHAIFRDALGQQLEGKRNFALVDGKGMV